MSVTGMAQQTVVSLLLPFSVDAQQYDPQSTKAELGRISKTYYQGFLLALDSLSHSDKKLRLQVFDTNNDSLRTSRILQREDFKNSQLIIGPVMQGGNKMVAEFASQKKIMQVSPLMTFSKTRMNEPYWVAANPELPNYARIFCNYVKQTSDTAVVVIISDKSSYDEAITPAMKKLTGEYRKIKFQFVDYTAAIDIQRYISATVPVHIIMPSNKEQNCYRVIYQLKDTTEQPHVRLYGFSQWFDFKNVEIDLWQRKNVHFITPAFIDYSSEGVKAFLSAYRARYSTEPTEDAFKGYDQARYFLQQLMDKGSLTPAAISAQSYTGLSTSYRFVMNQNGMLYNNYLNVIKFERNKLVRIY
jgi:ABC-type branched-subunit amino acid transport system substrate-binding protein